MRDRTNNLFSRVIDVFTDSEERKMRREALPPHREAGSLRVPMESEKLAASYSAVKAAAAREAATRIAAARAAAERAAAAALRTGIVITRSLRVHKDHNTSSQVVAGLVEGNQVIILGTWSDGKDTWAKLENGWVAMVFNGETFIKIA
jgi:hypothetical protein